MLTARFTSRSWSPGWYGRRPTNSTPSPTARPVCSPIRRSSSAGTSRGRIRSAREKISSWSSSTRTDVWKPRRPARPDTRTAPGEYRPHRPGRTVQRAEGAGSAPSGRNVRRPRAGSPARVTRGASSSSIVSFSSEPPSASWPRTRRGDRHVLALETARPGQRDVHHQLPSRPPPGHQRQRPRAGAATSTSATWPVRTTATRGEQRHRGQAPGPGRRGPADGPGGPRRCGRRGRRRRVRSAWPGFFHVAVLGTGISARIWRATSSPVTCLTHMSGRSTRRCASAGTATALMSSGVT